MDTSKVVKTRDKFLIDTYLKVKLEVFKKDAKKSLRLFKIGIFFLKLVCFIFPCKVDIYINSLID